jgi:LuxR family transcriptional regulator of spore coat protein
MPVPLAAVHSTLTPREREIFDAVLRQETTRQIAAARGLRYQTVKNYLTTIYDKLGVVNRVALCAKYQAPGTAPLEPAPARSARGDDEVIVVGTLK